MTEDGSGKERERTLDDRDFWFHLCGYWTKEKTWKYEAVDIDILTDKVSNMSFDRIKDHFSVLGFRNPKAIYAHDPDRMMLEGLYLITDEDSCRKTLQYIEALGLDHMDLFVDDDKFPLPEFTPSILPTEIVHSDASVEEWGRGEREEWADGYIEIVEEHAEITIQCSRKENVYVSPMGYISEPDEDDGEVGEVGKDSGENSNEDDGEVEATTNFLEANFSNVDDRQIIFALGMTFADAKEARVAIHEYGIKFGYKLKFVKSDRTRLRVICLNDSKCPFKLLVSKDGSKGGLDVKTANLEHNCFRQSEVPSASQAYVAKYFKNTIYENPKFTRKDMQFEMKKHLKINVSLDKCKRAKRMIINELEGSFKQEFANLEAYAEVLKKSNPGSKCEIQLSKERLESGKREFRRIFVMMDACRRNWLGGCKPIISLDGCFLKGVCPGMLLTAVGKDGDDHYMPIAWAVVSKENKVNWNWFLCWLRQELELHDGSQITIMSDMQKGLIDAVQTVLPNAEHRWCARHIYANWSKKWPGGELMKKFWICAWSSFEEEFQFNLSKLGEIHKQAAEDLMKYPVHTWCRAYQSNRCCSFMVDNNIAESFNSDLVEARHKPIISMLEDIRILVMSKIKDKKNLCERWIGEWSPSAMKPFQVAREAAIGCRVLWNGASGYEIGDGEDKHTILLDKKRCTCRVWELVGIPCCHAIAAMHYSKIEPLSMMSTWYHKSKYQKAYEFPILPVPEIKFFKATGLGPIDPPPVTKLPGKPKKKRIRGSNEPTPKPSGSTLCRAGQVQHCSVCNSTGHNKKRCQVGESSSSQASRQEKMVPRRPTKASHVGVGYYIGLDGCTTMNPGLSSERVIMEATQSFPHNSDPIIRRPIPNEQEINRTKRKLRAISFIGEGFEVRQATSLPFKPPGLKWKGAPSITGSQLLVERDARRAKKGKQGESQGTSASTTKN